MEVNVEVFDFEFLYEALRFSLVFVDNVLSDLFFDIEEVLEPTDGLMLLFVVGEGWEVGTFKLDFEVACGVIYFSLV